MSMDSESGFGLQPAFEERPRFNAPMKVGDPGRKQLQVSFSLTILADHATDY